MRFGSCTRITWFWKNHLTTTLSSYSIGTSTLQISEQVMEGGWGFQFKQISPLFSYVQTLTTMKASYSSPYSGNENINLRFTLIIHFHPISSLHCCKPTSLIRNTFSISKVIPTKMRMTVSVWPSRNFRPLKVGLMWETDSLDIFRFGSQQSSVTFREPYSVSYHLLNQLINNSFPQCTLLLFNIIFYGKHFFTIV